MTNSRVTAKSICSTELVLKMTRTKKANEDKSVERNIMLNNKIFIDSLCSTGGPVASARISFDANQCDLECLLQYIMTLKVFIVWPLIVLIQKVGGFILGEFGVMMLILWEQFVTLASTVPRFLESVNWEWSFLLSKKFRAISILFQQILNKVQKVMFLQHFAHENEKKRNGLWKSISLSDPVMQIIKMRLMAFDSCGRKRQEGKKKIAKQMIIKTAQVNFWLKFVIQVSYWFTM